MDKYRIKQYLHLHQQRDDVDKNVFANIEPIDCGDYYHLESASGLYKSYSQIDIYEDKLVCKSGCRGVGEYKLNEFINCAILEKSCVYVVDDITYKTDSEGRVCRVHASLPINDDIEVRPNGGNEIKKHSLEKSALDRDQAGHLIPRSLKGPNEAINIVPMSWDLNESSYNYVEKHISQFRDCKVEWVETIKYEGVSLRPVCFEITCSVYGRHVIKAKFGNPKSKYDSIIHIIQTY